MVNGVEIQLVKGKLEDVQLPVDKFDIIISEVRPISITLRGKYADDDAVDGLLPALRIHARHCPASQGQIPGENRYIMPGL
jgi:hypothetical protein